MISDKKMINDIDEVRHLKKQEKRAFFQCKNVIVNNGLNYKQSKRVLRLVDEILLDEMLNRKIKKIRN